MKFQLKSRFLYSRLSLLAYDFFAPEATSADCANKPRTPHGGSAVWEFSEYFTNYLLRSQEVIVFAPATVRVLSSN